MVTAERQASTRRLVLQMDAERRRIEARGVRAAILYGSRARRAAMSALRAGRDPAWAIRGQLLAMRPLLRDCMVTAHLTGRRRTLLAVDRIKTLSTVYDDAIDFLIARLETTPQQLDHLKEQYGAEALKVISDASNDVEKAVQSAVAKLTEEGAGVREGIKELRDTLESQGIAGEADYRLEEMFRTQTQLAYGSGRWNSLQDDAVQEILWGYEYLTVGDDRVRPSHAAMDHTQAPKDDPIWNLWWAPCGYNCRCTNVEIFREQAPTKYSVPRGVLPDKGFRFNPGKVFTEGT